MAKQYQYFACLIFACLVDGHSVTVRINWGIVFRKIGAIVNGENDYRHTFGVPIPNLTYTPVKYVQCDRDDLRKFHCEDMNKATQLFNDEFQSRFDDLKNQLSIQLNSIQVAYRTSDRRRRSTTSLGSDFCKDTSGKGDSSGGLAGFLGGIASSLFGTPTMSDIRTVDKHICQLADLAETNSKEIVASNKRLTSISKILNSKVDNLQDALTNINQRVNETEDNLIELSRQTARAMDNIDDLISIEETRTKILIKFLSNLLLHQTQLEHYLNRVAQWIGGIQQLNTGVLPEKLITVGDIEHVLKYIREVELDKSFAKMSNLRLMHDNPSAYYMYEKVVYTRTDNMIYVTMYVPLYTEGGMLTLYRVERTHLPTTHATTPSTIIANVPDFVAFSTNFDYYTEYTSTEYASCRGDVLKTCDTERALQRVADSPSCITAILEDSPDQIRKLCDVRLELNPVPSSLLYLENNTYLVHVRDNTTWSLECPFSTNGNVRAVQRCTNTCILTVPCQCSLNANSDFKIPYRLQDCPHDTSFPDIKLQYPTNLHLVSALYKDFSIGGDVFLDEPAVIEHRINLTISKSDWNSVVSKDEKYNIDFNKYLAEHQKQSELYAGKADLLLAKARNMNELNNAHLSDIETLFKSGIWKSLLSPSSAIGSLSMSMIIAILAIAMSIFNCCRARH